MIAALRRKREQRGEEGFTLIELLIVVAIIGIVASILIPNLLLSIQKAKIGAAIQSAKRLDHALKEYAIDYGQYPIGSSVGVDRLDPDTLEPLLALEYLTTGDREAIFAAWDEQKLAAFVLNDPGYFLAHFRPKGMADYKLFLSAAGIYRLNDSGQLEHL